MYISKVIKAITKLNICTRFIVEFDNSSSLLLFRYFNNDIFFPFRFLFLLFFLDTVYNNFYLHFGLYRLIIVIVQLRADFFRISVIHTACFMSKEVLLDDRCKHERHHVEPHCRLYWCIFYPSKEFSAFSVSVRFHPWYRLEIKKKKWIFKYNWTVKNRWFIWFILAIFAKI